MVNSGAVKVILIAQLALMSCRHHRDFFIFKNSQENRWNIRGHLGWRTLSMGYRVMAKPDHGRHAEHITRNSADAWWNNASGFLTYRYC